MDKLHFAITNEEVLEPDSSGRDVYQQQTLRHQQPVTGYL